VSQGTSETSGERRGRERRRAPRRRDPLRPAAASARRSCPTGCGRWATASAAPRCWCDFCPAQDSVQSPPLSACHVLERMPWDCDCELWILRLLPVPNSRCYWHDTLPPLSPFLTVHMTACQLYAAMCGKLSRPHHLCRLIPQCFTCHLFLITGLRGDVRQDGAATPPVPPHTAHARRLPQEDAHGATSPMCYNLPYHTLTLSLAIFIQAQLQHACSCSRPLPEKTPMVLRSPMHCVVLVITAAWFAICVNCSTSVPAAAFPATASAFAGSRSRYTVTQDSLPSCFTVYRLPLQVPRSSVAGAAGRLQVAGAGRLMLSVVSCCLSYLFWKCAAGAVAVHEGHPGACGRWTGNSRT